MIILTEIKYFLLKFQSSPPPLVWSQTNRQSVKCQMNLKYFPFDVQVCIIKLSTLSDFGRVQLDLQTNKDNFIASESTLNVWSVVETKIYKPGSGDVEEPNIDYAIILKRRPTIYITDIIVPCSLLSLLAGLSLFMAAGTDSRVEINLSVIVAISVYQLLASNNLPTSNVMPLLTKFLLVQTIMVYLSLLVSLFLAQMKGRIETRQNLANRIVYFVLVEIIGYVFFLRLDYRYKHVCRIKEKFNKIDVAVSNIDEDHRNTNENSNGSGHQHQNWAREEKEHLIDLEWQLIFTSLDRLAAVSYILFLCLWVGWLFWSVDDQEQIDEIVRGLDL